MFQPQQQIGPYTLVRQLGRGGFGEVWLAEKHGSLFTPQVALKLPLDPDPDLKAVQREALLWQQASGHPNVLSVIDAEIYNGQVVIVSEFAAGGSLASWLKQHGGKAPSAAEAVEMASNILAGLNFLHHLTPEPIIHRDLKPDNVLLQGGIPRLTDFGISRVLKTTAQTQYASGTPHYMPPEAFAGKYSPQSDVWATGVMLYQMLSGRLPFPQTDMPSLYGAILTGTPGPLPAEVPPELQAVVTKALTKDLAQRYASAADMKAALKSAPPVVVVQPPIVVAPKPDPVKNSFWEDMNDDVLPGAFAMLFGAIALIWRIVQIYQVDVPKVGMLLGFINGIKPLLFWGWLGAMLGGAIGAALNFLRKKLI